MTSSERSKLSATAYHGLLSAKRLLNCCKGLRSSRETRSPQPEFPTEFLTFHSPVFGFWIGSVTPEAEEESGSTLMALSITLAEGEKKRGERCSPRQKTTTH